MSITAAMVKELRERTGAAMMDCKKALEATGGDIEAAIEKMRVDGMAKADKKASRVAADGVVVIAEAGDAVAVVEVNSETDFVAKNDDFIGFADAAARVALAARPADIDALLAATDGDATLEDRRRALIAKLGENITLRRFEVVEAPGGVVGSYRHGSRIGVVVTLTGGDADLARDLAMHVAASRPQFVRADEVSAEVIETERRVLMAQVEDSGKPAEIVEKMIDGRMRKFLGEITLLGQPFVKDPDVTVEKLVKGKGAEVQRFVRFEVGEGIDKQEADFAAEVRATAQATLG